MNNNINTMSRQEAVSRMNAMERVEMTKFIDFPTLVGNPDVLTPSPNQLFAISAHERLQSIEKGRQEGQSLGYALDSVLRAINEPGSNGAHVSTDKWESEKKQKYCLKILDCMLNEVKEGFKLVAEAKNHIEFESKDNNGIRSISSIDFLACRPPRGADKGGIYLHEGAHMPNIVEILKAAKGCTAHAGYIRMCGTHQGNQTEFYSIITNREDELGRHPHRNWKIGHFPWWTFPGFCIDISLAIIEAWDMPTQERVERFGNWALKDLFESYALEDFQEEFECIVLDEKHSFYSDSLIKSCQPQTEGAIKSFYFEHVTCEGKDYEGIGPAEDLITDLANAIASGQLPGEWMWGMDVGRKKDTSEIIIGHKLPFGDVLIPRVIITLDNIKFQKQEQLVRHMLKCIPITKGFIDSTGIGAMLAENLADDHGQQAMPVHFTNEIKSRLANGLRVRMQKRGIILPIFSALTRQIHAIKKKVTLGGNETYDVDANANHHGDKFWSLALFAGLLDPSDGSNNIYLPEVIQQEPASFSAILKPGDAGFSDMRTWSAPRPWASNGSSSKPWRR